MCGKFGSSLIPLSPFVAEIVGVELDAGQDSGVALAESKQDGLGARNAVLQIERPQRTSGNSAEASEGSQRRWRDLPIEELHVLERSGVVSQEAV